MLTEKEVKVFDDLYAMLIHLECSHSDTETAHQRADDILVELLDKL